MLPIPATSGRKQLSHRCCSLMPAQMDFLQLYLSHLQSPCLGWLLARCALATTGEAPGPSPACASTAQLQPLLWCP